MVRRLYARALVEFRVCEAHAALPSLWALRSLWGSYGVVVVKCYGESY